MNNTPHSNRLHIAVFGRRNSGKSSLVNALTGQDTALVSATPGTTTDPVTKAMEVYPLGPCLFIDTPGFDDDEGELGGMRVERTLKTVEKADIALLLYEADGTLEQQWIKLLAAREIPVILILNKADSRQDTASVVLRIEKECGQVPVVVSAKEGTGIQGIFDAILEKLPENFGEQTITGNLVSEGDVVLLVMPQDMQAPKGRLILPQVQTIRELLDKKCLVMSCTTDKLQASLQALARPPKLIITDSQVFPIVYLDFTVEESCGKCTPCRIGNKRLLEILNKITEGRGSEKDLQTLSTLGQVIKDTALCGLGQTSPNPVLSTLNNFYDEYVKHVREKTCRARQCKSLLTYTINPELCIGCHLCFKHCPADAILGDVRKPHVINPDKCIKCGMCMARCKFKATSVAASVP